MRVIVLDCETTGVDPEQDRVVEVAGVVITGNRRRLSKTTFGSLIDPGMSIPPQATAIHHILNRDVIGKPRLEDYWATLPLGEPFVPVAHNAEFDSKFLPAPGDWVCTYRCARHVWPDAPSFSNQCLRYWLGLFQEPEQAAMPPHRAAADAWVTAHIAIRLLKSYSLERLIEMTKEPILERTVRFGKHRGEEWRNVPKDYIRWVLHPARVDSFDRDVVHTARHYA